MPHLLTQVIKKLKLRTEFESHKMHRNLRKFRRLIFNQFINDVFIVRSINNVCVDGTTAVDDVRRHLCVILLSVRSTLITGLDHAHANVYFRCIE